jgi:hypothetical protein
MMLLDSLSWALVALSLVGNYFVIKKNVLGQWLWAIGNLGWIIFDISLGAYSQAFLFAVYFSMCVWAIILWTKEAAVRKAPERA